MAVLSAQSPSTVQRLQQVEEVRQHACRRAPDEFAVPVIRRDDDLAAVDYPPVLDQVHRVEEVAPYLNPLLESEDHFDRDSALLAIKQGWGSTVNESFLKRLLQDTKQSKVKREVDAALKRIGG